jgi:DNA-binding transcriptional regulator YiaG
MLPWLTPKPPRELDVRAIRMACERYGYGQSTFAGMLGVSTRTLEGWEQRRRKPSGPARALLVTIAHNPKAYFDAIAAWNAQ